MQKLRIITALLIAVLVTVFPVAVRASENLETVRTLTQGVGPWVRIDCIRDRQKNFVKEPFHPKTKIRHEVLKKAFGTDSPHSRDVLVHFAPGWDKSEVKTPVLLVHGAATQAYHSWCHPYHLEVPPGKKIKNPGLMQYLSKKGYAVFALTFSHYHGDNFLQAQQLANAITYIRKKLNGGPGFKVDIICHSKGAMPTRIYLSDLKKTVDDTWRTPYRNDVRKCIFIASPLKGLDTPFRYYMYNLTVMTKEIDAPLGPDRMLFMGMYLNLADQQKFFPGQYQMLHNWVADGIPLKWQSSSPDFNITARALYNGGLSAVLLSRGIDHYRKKYGDVVARLNRKGLDPDVETSVIAGKNQAIDHIKIGFIEMPVGEMAAPSDGVVFLKSATYTRGLTRRGARLESLKVFDAHHVMLIVSSEVFDHINGVLK